VVVVMVVVVVPLQDQDWNDCVNAFSSTTAKEGDVVIQQGR